MIISFEIAATRSDKIHSELECSWAKFLWISNESFPTMIGIRISPYDCSDLPNKDSPDVAFNRVTENAQTNKAVYWGWQVSENAPHVGFDQLVC